MQLIFGVRWDLDKLQICAKGKSILEFHSVWKGNPKKSKKLKHSKKVPKNGLTEPQFREYMFIRLVRHPWKRKIHSGFPFARKNSVGKIQICGTESQLLNAITYAADIWWPLRSWQASNFFERKIHFWNSVPCQRKSKKLKQSKKSIKKRFDRAALVYHWCNWFKMFPQFMEIWFSEHNLFLVGTRVISMCLVVTELYSIGIKNDSF